MPVLHNSSQFSNIRPRGLKDKRRWGEKAIMARLRERNGAPVCWRYSKPVPRRLQRYIAMLLGRVFVAFGLQHGQGLNQLLAGLARRDDGINEAAIGSDVGAGEAVAEFVDFRLAQLLPLLGIPSPIEFALEDDIDRALRAHDGDLRSGPRIIHVG